MESFVKLTVKTPNQRIDDFQVDCDLTWSVKKLKEYLQDVYPSKPASSSQKLIYLGKLLKDHDMLKEVFGEWGVRTLHLVCAENNVSGDERSDSETAPNTSSSNSSSAVQEPPTSTTNPNIDATDGLRYRGNVYHSMPGNMSSMYSPFQTATTSMPNLAHWFHFQQQQQQQQQQPWSHEHAHMQHYYQQMHQWQQWHMAMTNGQWPSTQMFQSITPPLTPGSPSITTPPITTPLSSQTPQQQAEQQQQQPRPAQPAEQQQQAAVPQNIRMNAGVGGGAIADDDDNNENLQNRDWLDWMYMSMRFVMLLSIIYFYSSTSRFLMVVFLGFLVYVYQAGWLTPRRRQPVPVPEPVQPQDNNESNDSSQDGDDTNTEATVTEPPRPSALRVLCTFFVSFLTSLIPTAPPALQQQ